MFSCLVLFKKRDNVERSFAFKFDFLQLKPLIINKSKVWGIHEFWPMSYGP